MANKKKKKKFNPYFWLLGITTGIFTLNLILGVIRKPAHILKPISQYFYKHPSQTWSSYQNIFTAYETETLDATFLAALAQTESAGNPIATPYWEFSLKQGILSLFQPASSSLGLYQMTYDTYQDAKRFCFVDGRIRVDTERNNLRHCWKNNFSFRLSANDSIHLTSARLHYYSQNILSKYRIPATQKQRQQLAAVIQLCGIGKGEQFVRNKFSIATLGNCGSHSVKAYLSKVFKYQKTFMTMR